MFEIKSTPIQLTKTAHTIIVYALTLRDMLLFYFEAKYKIIAQLLFKQII
jgi:hypothetical protein